jgi:hypothetical protein
MPKSEWQNAKKIQKDHSQVSEHISFDERSLFKKTPRVVKDRAMFVRRSLRDGS